MPNRYAAELGVPTAPVCGKANISLRFDGSISDDDGLADAGLSCRFRSSNRLWRFRLFRRAAT